MPWKLNGAVSIGSGRSACVRGLPPLLRRLVRPLLRLRVIEVSRGTVLARRVSSDQVRLVNVGLGTAIRPCIEFPRLVGIMILIIVVSLINDMILLVNLTILVVSMIITSVVVMVTVLTRSIVVNHRGVQFELINFILPELVCSLDRVHLTI